MQLQASFHARCGCSRGTPPALAAAPPARLLARDWLLIPPSLAQGKVVKFVRSAAFWLGMGRQWDAVAEAPTLEAQRAAWEALWLVRLLRAVPTWLAPLLADVAQLLFFNRLTLWFGGGIPLRQVRAGLGGPGTARGLAGAAWQLPSVAGCTINGVCHLRAASQPAPQSPPPVAHTRPPQGQLISADGVHLSDYAARTFDGVAQGSHLRGDNYFYYSSIKGG